MIIFPAIDIKDGKVVRLIQGKFDRVTEYSPDPVSMAKHWEGQGAQWLHVVDLDGAQSGEIKNTSIILEIVKAIKIPVQTGGGIRKPENVKQLLDGGIARVVLGTKIIKDRDFLNQSLTLWPDKIVVSLDCQKGFVARHGWIETLPLKAGDLAKELQKLGLKYLVYTDIARDGMLKGPNFIGLEEMLESSTIPLIASGGISSLEDIKKLKSFEKDGLIGAIVGKALYEGKIDLKKALKIC